MHVQIYLRLHSEAIWPESCDSEFEKDTSGESIDKSPLNYLPSQLTARIMIISHQQHSPKSAETRELQDYSLQAKQAASHHHHKKKVSIFVVSFHCKLWGMIECLKFHCINWIKLWKFWVHFGYYGFYLIAFKWQ